MLNSEMFGEITLEVGSVRAKAAPERLFPCVRPDVVAQVTAMPRDVVAVHAAVLCHLRMLRDM